MTSLATIIGLLPMALKMGEGSEAYAPLARALVGGLAMSLLLTVFIVPAGFVLAYEQREEKFRMRCLEFATVDRKQSARPREA